MFLHSWRLRLPWMEKIHLLEAPIAWQASLKNEQLRRLGRSVVCIYIGKISWYIMITPYNSWVKWEVKSMQGCRKTSESLQTTKLVGQTMTVNYSVEKLPTGSARDFQETQWVTAVCSDHLRSQAREWEPQAASQVEGAMELCFFLWFTQSWWFS